MVIISLATGIGNFPYYTICTVACKQVTVLQRKDAVQ